jgi:drug/metabolite transporter (DMT)-like permease
MLATTNGTYYVAVERISVGAAVSVQFLAPLLVLGWTAAVRRQRVPPVLWVAGTTAVLGAAAVSGLTGAGAVDALGLVMAFAAAVSLAAYWLIGERLLSRLPMVPLLVCGFAVATVVWACFEPPWAFPFEVLDGRPGLLILVVGLLGTAVPYTFMSASQAILPAGHVGVLASAEPAFAALFAFVLLGERLGPVEIVGVALLTAGLMAVQGAWPRTGRLEVLPEA